ncbi:hypothetical protein ACX0G9_23195 [Flavitalea flava]
MDYTDTNIPLFIVELSNMVCEHHWPSLKRPPIMGKGAGILASAHRIM